MSSMSVGCVESRSGAPREGLGPSVAAPFGDGALSGHNQRTFPDPARQTGHASYGIRLSFQRIHAFAHEKLDAFWTSRTRPSLSCR
jgi:hypothetical protein